MDPEQQAALDAMDPETRAKTLAAIQAVMAMRQKPTEEQIIANAQARQAAVPAAPAPAPPGRDTLAAALAPRMDALGLGSKPPSPPLAAPTPGPESVVAATGLPAGAASPAQNPTHMTLPEHVLTSDPTTSGAPAVPTEPLTFRDGRFVGGTPQERAAAAEKEQYRLQSEGDAAAKEGQDIHVVNQGVHAQQLQQKATEAEAMETQRQKAYDVGTKELDRLRQKHEAYADELRRSSIDPDRFFKSANAATKFGLGISLITGGFLQGSKGLALNPGLKMLQDSIDTDVHAQEKGKEYLARATESIAGAVTDQRQAMVEQREGAAIKKQVFWENAQKEIDARAARFGAQTDAKAYEAASSWIQAKRMAEQTVLERLRMQAAAAAAANHLKEEAKINEKIGAQQKEFELHGDEHNMARARAYETITGNSAVDQNGRPIRFPTLPGAKGMEPGKPMTKEQSELEAQGSTLDNVLTNIDKLQTKVKTPWSVGNTDLRPNMASQDARDATTAKNQIAFDLTASIAGLKNKDDREFVLNNVLDLGPQSTPEKFESVKAMVKGLMGPNPAAAAEKIRIAREGQAVQEIVNRRSGK